MITNDLAVFLTKQMLWQALTISSPLVIAAVVSGLIISILQVATQIQDSSISFVPKILAVSCVLIFFSNWMLHSLISYTKHIIYSIPEIIHS